MMDTYRIYIHYKKDNKEPFYIGIAGRKKTGKPTIKSKKVLCHTTGEIFNSCSAAAHAHKIDSGNLGKHLNKKPYYNSIGGKKYTWL